MPFGSMVEAGMDVLPEVIGVDPARFVDAELPEQLDRSGFIDGLY